MSPIPDHATPTEIGFVCKWCGHTEAWTTETAAQSAAIVHIFTKHRDWWDQAGMPAEGPPTKAPEFFGRRFEEWERQS